MMIEFLYHLFSFDLVWIIKLVLLNLHWIFALFILIYIFVDGRKPIYAFIIFVFSLWLFMDTATVFGWVLLVGGFLMINYIVKIVVLAFAIDDPKMKDKLILINEAAAWTVWALYNFYLWGWF